jgi:hypothetical protein
VKFHFEEFTTVKSFVTLTAGIDERLLNLSAKSRKSSGAIFSDLRLAVFGNSETSKPGDWVQPMVSNFPSSMLPTSTSASASKASKIDDGVCKNVVTSLHVEIAFANAGSFNNPQV